MESLKRVSGYVKEVRAVNALLDASSGPCVQRRRQFEQQCRTFQAQTDPVLKQMSKVMASFKKGLFAGGNRADLPQDNLDLERWFRLPKGHERHIHGRRHAGVRIVEEGPTLLLALDAHRRHPAPFTEEELRPYRHADIPLCQRQATQRRKIMRRARSSKKRVLLLKELEKRYQAAV